MSRKKKILVQYYINNYISGLQGPRTLDANNKPLTSARNISVNVLSVSRGFEELNLNTKNSLMLMQWGQWLDHDITFGRKLKYRGEFKIGERQPELANT